MHKYFLKIQKQNYKKNMELELLIMLINLKNKFNIKISI